MDRADLDVARLAAAYILMTSGPHARTTQRLAFGKAQEPHRALESRIVSEESVAYALHQDEW